MYVCLFVECGHIVNLRGTRGPCLSVLGARAVQVCVCACVYGRVCVCACVCACTPCMYVCLFAECGHIVNLREALEDRVSVYLSLELCKYVCARVYMVVCVCVRVHCVCMCVVRRVRAHRNPSLGTRGPCLSVLCARAVQVCVCACVCGRVCVGVCTVYVCVCVCECVAVSVSV